MHASTSAKEAKSYYSDALAKSDYYLKDQEIGGEFGGKLAARLGLSGKATKEDFFALLENRNPVTGKRLTPRTSVVRTAGYDINFHACKSVSIIHALSGDDHILQAFRSSVAETMALIEADARTRVRKGGKDFDRVTGELLYTSFVHQTARPVPGHAPDMHLHSHVYVFNCTHDETENRVKAGQFQEINRKMPLYQSIFNKKLSDKLIEAGYRIRPTAKGWELDGVPQHVIDLFSKRTRQIDKVAREKGITDAKELDGLGARTRAAKDKGLSMAELKTDWCRQIREAEQAKPQKIKTVFVPEQEKIKADPVIIRYAPDKQDKPEAQITAQQCVDFVLSHAFVRASVVSEDKLLIQAYKHSVGIKGLSLTEIEACLTNDPRLIRIEERGRMVCTTKEVLAEERRMVQLAQAGRGKMTPLYHTAPGLNLDGQQLDAAQYLLTNTDRVSIVRGVAGAGKTTLLKELVPYIHKSGKETIMVAPTSDISRSSLREAGFEGAETVAWLLKDKAMQDKLQGQVLIMDEGGLAGVQDMTKVLELVTAKNARLIIVGDTRQHSSVTRGDALRILNTVGGIRTAEVSKIHRQKNGVYKSAVEDLSKGQTREGFDKLDGIGAIREVEAAKVTETLVADYMDAIKRGKNALIISPTHHQGAAITEVLREKLKQEGFIGKKEIPALSMVNENFTEAQKQDWRNYQPGQWVQFNLNMPGLKRGSRWSVEQVSEKEIQLINTDGQTAILPTQASAKFEVFQLKEIALAKGDKVRITKNTFDESHKLLSNGQTYHVAAIDKGGNIQLRNTGSNVLYTVNNMRFGHLAHAHCITSHASQGKTVDEVFIAQPAATFGATNAKQFYVSVSRARERVQVYTDDKEALLTHASGLGDRRSALELVAQSKHIDYVHHLEKTDKPAPQIEKALQPQKTIEEPYTSKHNYEPTL